MTRLAITLTAAGILVAHQASAQEAKLPRVEVSGVVSAILPIAFEGSPSVVLGGGPKVTFNVWKRIGVELQAEVIGPTEGSALYGLYLAQAKIPITRASSGGRGLCITAGLAGAASYQNVHETRVARPDGSTVVHPGFRRFRADAPNTLIIGVSRDHVVSRQLSGTWGLQALGGGIGGIGVRASVGVTFGMGGYQ
jgi:hypothetical protein